MRAKKIVPLCQRDQSFNRGQYRFGNRERKVMKLQDYIKYLLCSFLIGLESLHSCHGFDRRPPLTGSEDGVKQGRGILDVIFGRLKICGSCLCGRPNRYGEARILGGEYTSSHEFPWLVNIHVKSRLIVSGALINDRYVISAASQLIGATAPDVKVSLGEYDRCTHDVSSLNVSVDSILMYPEFNQESHAHDLVLLRLARPIKFERRVSPVCLPNPGSTYLGQVGTLVGWSVSGDPTNGGQDNRTCRPRKLGLPILGHNECIRSGIDPGNFHNDSGCVGVLGANSIVCQNDVGSSLQYRSYTDIYDLIGIITDVNKCDDKPRTALYTRLGPHLNWILQNTKDACYCPKN